LTIILQDKSHFLDKFIPNLSQLIPNLCQNNPLSRLKEG
jgi:hypothetical protein